MRKPMPAPPKARCTCKQQGKGGMKCAACRAKMASAMGYGAKGGK